MESGDDLAPLSIFRPASKWASKKERAETFPFRLALHFSIHLDNFRLFSIMFYRLSRKGEAMAITPRQRELFDYLSRFITSYGHAPTIAEMRGHLGLNSPSTAHHLLTALERE